MLVVSTYVLVQKEKKITYFVEFIFDPSCLLCLAGSITVVVAFLGCGGALRENTGFLRAVCFNCICGPCMIVFCKVGSFTNKMYLYAHKIIVFVNLKYSNQF